MNALTYLVDQFVIWAVSGRNLAAVNLSLFLVYILLRIMWPIAAGGATFLLLILCFATIVIFALNIRLLLIAALPKIVKVRDRSGEPLVPVGLQAASKSFGLIVVAYIATLTYGFLFLIELTQLSANWHLISCTPNGCDLDRMALATRVVSSAMYGGLHIAAENVFGLVVLLLHSIMNIVMLTLLIPTLLAFRD